MPPTPLVPIRVLKAVGTVDEDLLLVENFDTLVVHTGEMLANLDTSKPSTQTQNYPAPSSAEGVNLPQFVLNWHTPKWSIAGFTYDQGKIVLAEGNSLYNLDLQGALVTSELAGTPLWSSQTLGGILRPPVQYLDGVFLLEANGRIHKVRKSDGSEPLGAKLWGPETGVVSHGPILGSGHLYWVRGGSLYSVSTTDLSENWVRELKTDVQVRQQGFAVTWHSSISPLFAANLAHYLFIPFDSATTGMNGVNLYSYLATYLPDPSTGKQAQVTQLGFFTADTASGATQLTAPMVEEVSDGSGSTVSFLQFLGWGCSSKAVVFTAMKYTWTVRPGRPAAPVRCQVVGTIRASIFGAPVVKFTSAASLPLSEHSYVNVRESGDASVRCWIGSKSTLLDLELADGDQLTVKSVRVFDCSPLEFTCAVEVGHDDLVVYAAGTVNGTSWIVAFDPSASTPKGSG